MHFAFFDESYDRRHFWYGGVLVPTETLHDLVQKLDQLKPDNRLTTNNISSGRIGITPEIHAKEISDRAGPWRSLESTDQSMRVFYDVVRILDDCKCVSICYGLEHKKLTMKTKEDVAFRYWLEKVDRWGDEHEQRILAIGDETQKKLHASLIREFHNGRTLGTGGWKPKKINRIVDSVYFAPSETSRGIQAADLVTFVTRKKHQNNLGALKIWESLSDLSYGDENPWIPN